MNNLKVDSNQNSESQKRESTRSYVAKLFVWAFYIILSLTFGFGVYYKFEVNDIKDLILAVSGVLSGPLGFVLGFYFKSEEGKS